MFDTTKIREMYEGLVMPPTLSDMLQFCDLFKQQEKLGLVPKKMAKKSTEFRKKGNDLYQKKRHSETSSHRMILSLYSQSIAYAPNGSEELASALSNRSALLLHLNKYDLCMKDIDKALSITASSELQDKLLSRQTKCIQLNHLTQQKSSRQNELPEFTLSESISCAADCIKLECNEKFGRHYVATQDIEPGKVIISEKTLYNSVHSEHIYVTCSHCLAFAWIGVPCESCVYAIYCSENCKNEAWSEYHDIQCTITSILNCEGLVMMNLSAVSFRASTLVKTMIITVRKNGLKHILEEAMENQNLGGFSKEDLLSNNKLNCAKFRFIYNLAIIKNEQDIDGFLSMVLSLSLTFLMEKYKLSECKIDFATFMVLMKMILGKLYNIQECNGYGFQTCICPCADIESCPPECVSRRGTILAPCSSLINHSCDQNVSRIFLPGPRIVLFSIRAIKKGEQICTTYGTNAYSMSKEARRAYLLKCRGFVCECRPCVENWPRKVPVELTTPTRIQELCDHFPFALMLQYEKILAIVETPRSTWYCNKELLKDSIAMLNIIYKNFDDILAYHIAEPLKTYLDACFLHFYGEIVDFPNTC